MVISIVQALIGLISLVTNDRNHCPFVDFVVHSRLVQTVASPTRIENILNLVLTDDPGSLCSVVTGLSFVHSDHML